MPDQKYGGSVQGLGRSVRTGRGSSVSRRTVLFSEGGGGRHGSAPGGSCTRSPAAEQHRLLPRDEWRSAQGSEQRYGQGKGHAQAGSDECSVHARPFSAEVSRRQHGAGIHTNLLKAGEIGGVRALTYFTVCLADSRHRYGLQPARRSWLQAAGGLEGAPWAPNIQQRKAKRVQAL